jgi:hypothetical protein
MPVPASLVAGFKPRLFCPVRIAVKLWQNLGTVSEAAAIFGFSLAL